MWGRYQQLWTDVANLQTQSKFCKNITLHQLWTNTNKKHTNKLCFRRICSARILELATYSYFPNDGVYQNFVPVELTCFLKNSQVREHNNIIYGDFEEHFEMLVTK